MALNDLKTPSITDIENQIAKVTAELEKTRAAQFAAAEKALLAAQKRTDAARVKVEDLTTKGGTTAAAQNRLSLAKAALTDQETLLAVAQEQFDSAKAVQDAADDFAKNVALVMSGKKLGKKIKFTKQEKKVIKEEKKDAKKLAKAEKKIAKQNKKAAKKAEKQLAEESTPQIEATKPEAVAPAKPKAKPAAAKKPVAKQPRAKKAAPAETKEPAELQAVEPIAATLPAPITVDNVPTDSSAESPAREEGKDVVVETETLPPTESVPEENAEKPLND